MKRIWMALILFGVTFPAFAVSNQLVQLQLYLPGQPAWRVVPCLNCGMFEMTNDWRIFNPVMYGATGNGVTNDSPAMQATMNAIMSAGGGLMFVPSGRYKLNTQIFETNAPIMMVGAGRGVTQFLVNNTNGGFSFYVNQSLSNKWAITLNDFDIINTSGTNSAKALSIVGSGVSPYWQGLAQSTVERVRVLSSTPDATTENWTVGFYMRNLCYSVLRDLSVHQVNSLVTLGIQYDNSANSSGFYATFGVLIDRPTIQGGLHGVDISGAVEGVYIYPYEFTGQYTGIAADGANGTNGYNPVLHIKGGAINSKRETITVNNWQAVQIEGVDCYKGVGTGDEDTHNIFISNVSKEAIVTGSKMGSVIASTNAFGNQAVYYYRVKGGLIANNMIHQQGNGLSGIGVVNSTNVQVVGNILITDNGTTNQAMYATGNTNLNFASNCTVGWPKEFNGDGVWTVVPTNQYFRFGP